MISTEVLLKNIGMSSVNQTHAQIKLLEMWKAVNVKDNPIKVEIVSSCPEAPLTRSGGNSRLLEVGKSNLCSKTFKNDAIRIWNHAPNELKECATVWSAKKAIKQFSLTLPI